MSTVTPNHDDLINELRTLLRGMKAELNAPSNSEHDEGYDLAVSRYAEALERLMPRATIADGTDEEAAASIGMWATVEGVGDAVILSVDGVRTVTVSNATIGHKMFQANRVAPRPDLPRAWNKDGTHPNPAPEPAQQERISPAECDSQTAYIVRVAGRKDPVLARRADPADVSRPWRTWDVLQTVWGHPDRGWSGDEDVTIISAIAPADD